MILKNDKFEEANPTVVTNARNVLEDDMQAVHFPWKRNNSGPGLPKEPISLIDRIIVRGKYGKWWELGHHANPEKPGEVYAEENAVRIRAGLLNIVSWLAICNIFYWQEPSFVTVRFSVECGSFLEVHRTVPLTSCAIHGTDYISHCSLRLYHFSKHWAWNFPYRDYCNYSGPFSPARTTLEASPPQALRLVHWPRFGNVMFANFLAS
mmetsp:Transcript_16817/g.39652  ORF Transcript_16817/g.39652 Transcript_16817/m.39652 type:complete len:208 (+) Transcript_16817:108-731(+)